MQNKVSSSSQTEKPSSASELSPSILNTILCQNDTVASPEENQHSVIPQNLIGNSEPYLKEEDAARLIRVTQRTLQAWRLKGIGPPFIRISRRCIRYRPKDISMWAIQNSKSSTSEK